MQINSDFEDLLQALNDAGARFLIVGGMALAFHDRPRLTKDLDVWIARSPENARRVYDGLARFGAPLESLTAADLQDPDLIFQIGVPPVRVDVLTSISGVEFEEAWQNRIPGRYGAAAINVIGKDELIRNKRAAARPQDIVDADQLDALKKSR